MPPNHSQGNQPVHANSGHTGNGQNKVKKVRNKLITTGKPPKVFPQELAYMSAHQIHMTFGPNYLNLEDLSGKKMIFEEYEDEA